MPKSVQLADLPDPILLRIFSCFVVDQIREETTTPCQDDIQTGDAQSSSASSSEDYAGQASGGQGTGSVEIQDTKTRKTKKQTAGVGARTLCRLCCCSHRFNHLASADQLWQPLTLTRYPNRHWPTTDQKALDLIQIQREHQLKLSKGSSSQTTLDDKERKKKGEEEAPDGSHVKTSSNDAKESESVDPSAANQDGEEHKEQKRKFYRRYEQRAFRRKFGALDPELKYTSRAWTNTMWTWKRTFFGDFRFVNAKDVETPNRIDHKLFRRTEDPARQECERCWRPTRSCICSSLTTQEYCNCRIRIMILQHPRCQVSIGTIRILKMSFKYCQIVIGKDFKAGRSKELDQALEDPNCTPLLLYPSHSAIDIHSLSPVASVSTATNDKDSQESSKTHSRYFCQGCTHVDNDDDAPPLDTEDRNNPIQSSSSSSSSSAYPYRLIIALDGSWSHAKIMYRFNPRLQKLTQVKFPNPPQSIYHELKREPKATYISTAEAVGQAVALLGWPTPITTTTSAAASSDNSLTDAPLLLEDLMRPLKRLIEIQQAMLKSPEDQAEAEHDNEQNEETG
ncbi:MAG: DTW domain-containing protein [Benniella sp.]|nr:MAG: DTW domain-containing protein [Benniella sp.]